MLPIASQLGSLDILAGLVANSGTAIAGENLPMPGAESATSPFSALLEFGPGIEPEASPAFRQPATALADPQVTTQRQKRQKDNELHQLEDGFNLGGQVESPVTNELLAVGKKSRSKLVLPSSRLTFAKATKLSADLGIASPEFAFKWERIATQSVSATGLEANPLNSIPTNSESQNASKVDAEYSTKEANGDRRYSAPALVFAIHPTPNQANVPSQITNYAGRKESRITEPERNSLRDSSMESKGGLELDKRNSRWLPSSANVIHGSQTKEGVAVDELPLRFPSDSSFKATNAAPPIHSPEGLSDKVAVLVDSVSVPVNHSILEPPPDHVEGQSIPRSDEQGFEIFDSKGVAFESISSKKLSERDGPVPESDVEWKAGSESPASEFQAQVEPNFPRVSPIVKDREYGSTRTAPHISMRAVGPASAKFLAGSQGLVEEEIEHLARQEPQNANPVGVNASLTIAASLQNSSTPSDAVSSYRQSPGLRADARLKAARLEPQVTRGVAEKHLVVSDFEPLSKANTKRGSVERVSEFEKPLGGNEGEARSMASLREFDNSISQDEGDWAPPDVNFAEAPRSESNLTREVGLNEIARQIASAAEPDQGWILMEIQPPELGKLEILVARDGNGFSAQIVAHDRATGDALSQQRTELIEALGQQGLDLRDLQIHAEPHGEWLGEGAGFQPEDHPSSDREPRSMESQGKSSDAEAKPGLAAGLELPRQNSRVNIVV